MGYKLTWMYIGSQKVRPTWKLPSEYQEVEYIQTTGTQWIDTWYSADSNTQTEVKIEVTTTEQNTPIFWGYAWAISPIYKYTHLTPYNYSFYFWLNGGEGHYWTYSTTIWTQYTIVFNNSSSQFNLNGTNLWSVSGTSLPSWATMAVSARISSLDTDYFWKFKYFYFNLYDKDSWTYVRKLIPCYRKLDSVIWMYDIVNNVFYTNAGSWTFIKWNDVN